ncbi:MAG: alpha/beta hydrolase [Bacteroidota bacterium]
MGSNNLLNGYADVNGLKMYYEIHGQGKPLILIHGGGSTIETSFGRIIPALAKNRQIIAVELQAHGRTNDRNTDLSFEQDADDISELLKQLRIPKADFLGFSNGAHTILSMTLRHPALLNKIILASTFFKRSGAIPNFWEGFDQVTLNQMPSILKEHFLQVNNNEAALENMFNKDVQRMKSFTDWSEKNIKDITAATLIINSTHDVGTPEHAVEMYRLIPNCELAIFPGGHGAYLGAIESLENGNWPAFNATNLIEEFLDKNQLP